MVNTVTSLPCRMLVDPEDRPKPSASDVLARLYGAPELAQPTVDLLWRQLNDPGWCAPEPAPPTVDDHRRQLSDPGWGAREQAVRDLADMGSEDALAVLMEALTTGQWQVGPAAARALARAGCSRATPELEAGLRDPAREMREACAEALGILGSAGSSQALASVLDDPSWQVRWAAIDALAALPDDDAQPHIIAALGNSDAGVRRRAAQAARLWGSEGVAILRGALEAETDPSVRTALIRAVGRTHSRDAVSALCGVLVHGAHDEQIAAATALAVLGPDGVQALVSSATAGGLGVPSVAVDGMMSAGTAGQAGVCVLVGRGDDSLRRTAADALRRTGRIREVLAGITADRTLPVALRSEALQCACDSRRLGLRDAQSLLGAFAASEDPATRQGALDLIAYGTHVRPAASPEAAATLLRPASFAPATDEAHLVRPSSAPRPPEKPR